jgi:hypothetical protein
VEPPATIARDATDVAALFRLDGDVESLAVQPGGHINSSYAVATRNLSGAPAGKLRRYLLQRVNTQVFTRPEVVMRNVAAVSDFLETHLAGSSDRERRSLRLVPTLAGEAWAHLPDGAWWRCFEFVENSVSLLEPRDANDAREAAKACGRFLADMACYTGPRFEDSLPRFHDTPWRYEQLDRALAGASAGALAGASAGALALTSAGALALTSAARRDEAREWIDFAGRRRAGAGSITSAVASGALPERIAHNDAKISNVLFDRATRRSLCVIDLDTVMATSSLFDFGDLVRSMASGRPEDERDLARIDVRRDVFVALVGGFLDGFGGVIVRSEREHLVEGARIMALQQGVRFLADHLAGDVYFRIHHTGQNLDRARAQFRLVQRLEERRAELEAVVAAS